MHVPNTPTSPTVTPRFGEDVLVKNPCEQREPYEGTRTTHGGSRASVVAAVASDVEAYDAETVLTTALRALGHDRLALAASFGPEDIVILDLLSRIEARPRVFTLDTGRLPNETYELIERLRHRFDVEVEVYFPDAAAVEAMVRARGLNLFYASLEDRLRCCDGRRLDHRPAPRAGTDPGPDAEDLARPRAWPDLEGRPARRLDRGAGLGAHPGERPPLPRAPRPRLRVDRLRAVHAGGRPRRGFPLRPLVVGGTREPGVRASCAARGAPAGGER